MADEIASLKVVIEAEDRASAVISSVGASMSGLGSAGAAAAGQTAAVNAAMTGSAKSSAVLGSAVTQTKNNLKQLESGLASQKATTLEYTKSLRDSANTLREKQTAVQDAAKAYKSNTASIKENISGLEDQRKHLDSLTNINNQIISYASEQNKGLSKNSAAYKENAATIKRVTAENKELAVQRKENMNAILANESALKQEEQNYKNAQTAVKGAAKSYEEIRDKVKQSKAAEVDYSNSIDKVNAELLKKQQEYEKLQKNESIIDTGKAWKEVGSSIDTISKPLQVASVAIAGLGTASAMAAISFEDSFAGVKKTVDGTPEQLNDIKQSIIDMSTVGINGHNAIPMTTDKLNELAAAGGQLGITVDNIADFTEVMAQMETATNLAGEEGAATLARFQNVMGISQGEIRNVGSAIVDLGNNSATTEAEIAAMALRMGKYGQTVGMSAADVLGYSAALSSLGIEAQMGGSAVGRTWLSIETAVASGGEELQAFAKYAGKSANEFKEQWNTDSKGAFNGLLQGLQSAENLTLALEDLGINNTQDIQAMMALVNGYDLVTESVDRANTAYQENTALQAEFDAKAETTASQLAVTKQNFIEAARSIGETMLPTIVDVTGGLSSMAQGLASASNGTKKFVVGAGAAVVGLGALSKGVAGTVKTVGGVIESVGTIKKAFAKGGALAKFAPTLTAIGSAAGPVALGIAAIGTAALASKAIYDEWYDSKYRFAEGLGEEAEKLKQNYDAWKSLNDIQWEYRNLTDKINSGELQGEDLEAAKSRLEEIKNILKEEYEIDVDSSDIDDAIEKAKELSKIDFYNSKRQLQNDINDLQNPYEKAVENLPEVQAQYDAAKEKADAYDSALLKIGETQDKFSNGAIDSTEYAKEFVSVLNELGKQTGKGDKFGDNLLKKYEEIYGEGNTDFLYGFASLNLSSLISELDLDGLDKKIKVYQENIRAYKEAVQDLADVNVSQFEDAFKSGGDTEQYIAGIKKYTEAGILSADEYAKKLSLIKSGVSNIQDAWEQAENGDNTALDNIVSNYIDLSKQLGSTAEAAVQGAALIKSGFSDVSQVTAEKLPEVLNNMRELGNVQGLDMTSEKLTQMAQSMKLIPENTKIEFDGEGNIVLKVDDTEVEEYEAPEKPGKAPYSPDTSQVDAWTPPEKRGTVTYTPVIGGVGSDSTAAKINMGTFHWAKGTTDAPEGLAVVNDEKGVADPTELIKHGDAYYMLEGRDVPVWLDEHDKVYTAAQTKAIMSGMGIPHYASGKNNSDAFTSAKDDWTHYTKTHSITTAQELEKWLEFQEKYKENEKDIWDIEEQIFSLQQKITQELNNQSKAYLEERSALNDWEDIGDSPLEAFGRIKDRNYQDLQDAKITWDDYVNNVSDAGETLYDDMKKYSDNWLEHQRKYHNMSIDEYIAGIDREEVRLEEFYANDAVNYQKYIEEKQAYEEKRFDAIAEKNADEYTAWKKDADAWQEMRSTYGDWDKYGDSEEAFLKRKIDRVNEKFKAGKISFEEYIDDTNEYSMDLYKAQEGYIDDLLQKQSDYISDLREQFSEQEQALRDSWDVEDRAVDMADVQNQLDIYAGAVTDRGQQKYKELQEQMKQLQRDEELYNLQVANNATIERLEDEYAQMEEGKANILEGLRTANIDISGYVNSISESLSQTSGRVESLLSTLINKFDSFKVESNSMTDNRKYSYNISQMTPEQIQELLNGLVGK